MTGVTTTLETTAKIKVANSIRLSPALVAQLERACSAKFSERHITEMTEIITLYVGSANELPLWMIKASSINDLGTKRQQPERRAAVVESLFLTWRDAGGRGHGVSWDVAQGKFVRLVLKIFEHIGEKISGRTVRRDLESFRRELELVGPKRKLPRRPKTLTT